MVPPGRAPTGQSNDAQIEDANPFLTELLGCVRYDDLPLFDPLSHLPHRTLLRERLKPAMAVGTPQRQLRSGSVSGSLQNLERHHG